MDIAADANAKGKAMKSTAKKMMVECESVGRCIGYVYRDRIWYNSESPEGCSFIPRKKEDVNNHTEIEEYGETFEIDTVAASEIDQLIDLSEKSHRESREFFKGYSYKTSETGFHYLKNGDPFSDHIFLGDTFEKASISVRKL